MMRSELSLRRKLAWLVFGLAMNVLCFGVLAGIAVTPDGICWWLPAFGLVLLNLGLLGFWLWDEEA